MHLSLLLNVVLALGVVNGALMPDNYEDYFDPIAYYLLFDNDTALYEANDIDADNVILDAADDPVFSNGLWTCGICENVTESKLIDSEVYDVDTNIDNENYLQMQIGLSFDNMRCITVLPNGDSEVKRISGSCIGPSVTLHVGYTQHFVVRVFGD